MSTKKAGSKGMMQAREEHCGIVSHLGKLRLEMNTNLLNRGDSWKEKEQCSALSNRNGPNCWCLIFSVHSYCQNKHASWLSEHDVIDFVKLMIRFEELLLLLCKPNPNLRVEEEQKPNTTFSSSAANNMKPKGKAIAQCNADAGLVAEFEQSGVSGKSNYSRSVVYAPQSVPEEQITANLSKILERFGCMIAIEEPTFRIISYSENCFELLGLHLDSKDKSKGFKDLIGMDARSLFIPSSRDSLGKAMASTDISLLNPIWVYSKSSRKTFFAILHRIDVGTVIDLEPARLEDLALSFTGAVHSQKLAVREIAMLQSLRGGDIGLLCDTVAEDVQKITGYDRVMVYKFHYDYHGEVVSEIRRSDLEPYLGVHYPVTDIPQAVRFLFKQNRVRLICDCHANPVKVIQSNELQRPLCFANSTLRSPHGCHIQYMENMGSIASLVMAVVINGNDSKKLWGLVVCHHTSRRYVPFPPSTEDSFITSIFDMPCPSYYMLAHPGKGIPNVGNQSTTR
ncbi:phytochrome E-like [Hibiscus syriacus]|uniref:phytochrome E-like n=1 Tax=Hibiscus syriacus TaxID=106335 RepID=UPI0019209743|nr:phytochrome E-like [Hibiscus syriacus]